MKVGKSIHVDFGTALGIAIAILGVLPEIVTEVKQILPEKYAHYLTIIGLVVTATRGQVIRREQYRTDEVFDVPPTDINEPPSSTADLLTGDADK